MEIVSYVVNGKGYQVIVKPQRNWKNIKMDNYSCIKQHYVSLRISKYHFLSESISAKKLKKIRIH